ncbi:hypothetical protein AABB24_003884, partial [Solanum stoloniferum]
YTANNISKQYAHSSSSLQAETQEQQPRPNTTNPIHIQYSHIVPKQPPASVFLFPRRKPKNVKAITVRNVNKQQLPQLSLQQPPTLTSSSGYLGILGEISHKRRAFPFLGGKNLKLGSNSNSNFTLFPQKKSEPLSPFYKYYLLVLD